MAFTDNWFGSQAALNQLRNKSLSTPEIYNSDPVLSAMKLAQDQSQKSLFDPATMQQVLSALTPYFNQQQQNLSASRNQAYGQAGQQAGAMAAARGLANPSTFVRGAQGQVNEQYANSLGNLQASQLQAVLGGTQSSGEFSSGNIQRLLNTYMQGAQMQQQQAEFAYQKAHAPNFGDYLLGGLLGGAGQFLGGLGSGLGKSWGGG